MWSMFSQVVHHVYFVTILSSLFFQASISYEHYPRKEHKGLPFYGPRNIYGSGRMEQQPLEETIENDESKERVLEGRIVGGARAKYGDLPWQVAVRNTVSKNLCGGTLVEVNGLKFIITAAHCVWHGDVNATNHLNASWFKISAGIMNIFHAHPRDQHYNVSRIVVHEWYDPRYHLNDIALIFSKQYISTNAGVKPANLPHPDFAPPDYVTVSGYGTLKEGGSIDGFLKMVNVPLYDWDKCKAEIEYLTNNHFCVINPDPGTAKGFCEGDSGGPGMGYNYTRKLWYVYGEVNAHLESCGSSEYPAKFLRISKYIEWIRGYALTHILLCGTAHPFNDHPSKYPNCPWPYRNPGCVRPPCPPKK